ncbi:MAG: KH domain-containing protein [Patescibacteria group bacterium]
MKNFTEYLVKLIVNKPECVELVEDTQPDITNLRLKTAPEDIGLVIGKGGKTIRSLRTLLRIKGIKENKRVNLELEETDSEQPKPVSAA